MHLLYIIGTLYPPPGALPAGSTPPPAVKPCPEQHRSENLLNNNAENLRDSSTETVNWELRAQPNLSYPSNTTEGSKRSTRLQKGDVSQSLQVSRKLPKAVPNEASQQEESNATTLTSIEVVYHRQSEKIRSRLNQTTSHRVHTRIWTRHSLLKSEMLNTSHRNTQILSKSETNATHI
ncbi:hypothetical protein F511_03727 [Dorcoceras hygrometricum]|uniref:Uncharacterized protein n=1 Tax=Dorcoceras hygrometricum TaxID=472368 RepID=A0A2Z7BBG6_9LAMI|nr:hypothetical protein F511_03727 [Dorcoceras hygrometricum]